MTDCRPPPPGGSAADSFGIILRHGPAGLCEYWIAMRSHVPAPVQGTASAAGAGGSSVACRGMLPLRAPVYVYCRHLLLRLLCEISGLLTHSRFALKAQLVI